MANTIDMPQMGYDMHEGTLIRWLKTENTEIEIDEPIAEIETDKAVVEFNSTHAGILLKVLVSEGTTVSVGNPIAIIGEAGEQIDDIATGEYDINEPELIESTVDEQHSIPLPPSSAESTSIESDYVVRASPVARRLAMERDIDLELLTGTGPGGRITRDDVMGFEGVTAPDTDTEIECRAPSDEGESAWHTDEPIDENLDSSGDILPLTTMRQQIAKVTSRSKREIPHFYVSVDVNMTSVMELRKQVNQNLDDNERISVNDLIIKACVDSIQRHPKFNASYSSDGIRLHENVNVGIAVAQDEGLVVPAILGCNSKSLFELAIESKDLVRRVNSGALRPEEYTGGTFAISNMGMFDVGSFMAIVQPPQSAMLAVGTVSKRPVVQQNEIVIADMMTATLSADHRVVDGAEGARFIGDVKTILENPFRLLL